MTITLYTILALGVTSAVVALAWRLSSRRSKLPCPSWLAWMVELDNPLARSNNARTIVDRLELQPGMKVLDLGCGPGRLTIPLAQRVGPQGEVVAVDIQQCMLQRAEAKAQAAALMNITFLQLGAGEGKLEQNEFDRVVLVTVLGEVPDRQGAMKEIFSALKPGGLLSVTELVFDPHYQSKRTILGLSAPLGFQERNCFGNRLAYTLILEKPTLAD